MVMEKLTLNSMKSLISELAERRETAKGQVWTTRLDNPGRFEQYHRLCWQLGERYDGITLDDYEVYDSRHKNTPKGHVTQEEAKQRVTEFCEQLPERVGNGGGMILFGPPGTGKDHLMVCCMFWATLKHGYSIEWRDGAMLGQAMRNMIGNNDSETVFVGELVRPQILCLSDPVPPRGEASKFFVDLLQRVVDQRYRQGKSTWVTINARNGKDAEEKLAPALVDRLRHNSLSIHCNWRSYRKAK